MPVNEVATQTPSQRQVLDEVFIALLEILEHANQVVSLYPQQSRPRVQGEVSEQQTLNLDAGYPFSFCDGFYFADLLAQAVTHHGQVRSLKDLLAHRSQAYCRHQDWLDVLPIDDIFAIRPTSAASVSMVENVQLKTLGVLDAMALLDSLKQMALVPGQLLIEPAKGPTTLITAGISYPMCFRVVETEWAFEPVMTMGGSDLNWLWYFHAMVHALYQLVVHGGNLTLSALGGQGSCTLSLHTLRGLEGMEFS